MKSLVDPFSKPGHVIRRLQQYAVLIFHEQTKGFDLTPTQYVTLQVLEHRPGIDQVSVSEVTAIDRSMTARIVDVLVQRGLIDKRSAANDRRANSLFITGKARRLLEAIEVSADRSQARILAPLRPAERREFMRMVKTLLDGYGRDHERASASEPEASVHSTSARPLRKTASAPSTPPTRFRAGRRRKKS
jgi:MarR family transcriptional regulator, lower aerobic nicotinate degradation pathway regulator